MPDTQDTGVAKQAAPASPTGGALPRIGLRRGRVLLVATGAIGVVHLPEWVLFLRVRYGWSVRVCLTHSAERLVSRESLAALSQAPVEGPDWRTADGLVPHLELADWPDLVIVAPATTNFIAKCAAGITDSLALAAVTCAEAPVLIAPSIPEAALSRPAVRRNLRILTEDGYHVVPMGRGYSAHRGAPATTMPGLPSLLRAAARILPDKGAEQAAPESSGKGTEPVPPQAAGEPRTAGEPDRPATASGGVAPPDRGHGTSPVPQAPVPGREEGAPAHV